MEIILFTQHFKKSYFIYISAALSLSLLLGASSAMAETKFTRSQAFGDWLLQCFNVEDGQGKKQEKCSLTQGVGTEKVKLIASLSVVQDKQRNMLRLTVPLGVSLASNVSMKINESIGSMRWLTCLNSGCLAEIPLNEKLLNRLKTKEELTITANTLTKKRDLILKFSLKGLSKGLSSIK